MQISTIETVRLTLKQIEKSQALSAETQNSLLLSFNELREISQGVKDEIVIQVKRELVMSDLSHDVRMKIYSLFREGIYQIPPSQSSLTKVAHLTYHIFSFPKKLMGHLYDFLIDGKHPWKYQKYKINLEAVLKGLEESIFVIEGKKCGFQEALQHLHLKIVKTDFEKLLLLNLDTLYQIQILNLHEARNVYRKFLLSLRAALGSKDYQEEIASGLQEESIALQIIKKICTLRFTGVHLYSFCEELVQSMITIGLKQLDQLYPDTMTLFESIPPLQLPFRTQLEALSAVPQSYKAPGLNLFINLLQGASSVCFDPQVKANMPTLLCNLRMSAREINIIRSGTPTMQLYHGKAEINPEFEAFITQHPVLYISLQDSLSPLEGKRNQALLELHRKYPQFTFAVTSNDGDFYHQVGPFADFKDNEDFKNCFLKNLATPSYYIPQNLSSEQLLEDLFQETFHDLFFEKMKENRLLMHPERQIFIEIFHTKLALHLLKESGANQFFLVCKDGKDRAGKDNALLFIYLTLLLNGKITDEYIQMMKVNLHGVSLIVKKDIMNSRWHRFDQAFNYLCLEEVQQRLKKRNQIYQIEALQVKKFPEQNLF